MVTGKRGILDVLRRSADNTIANWQLILIRFGEMLLFGLLAILTMIAAFMPILIAVGIEISKLSTINDVENAGLALMEKWYLLGWVVLAILGLLAVFTAIHGFVEAGSARVYVDAERIAGPAMTGARSRFRVFSAERFLAGAKDGWWTLFWIYNICWTAACLILLIPLLPTAIGMLLTFREQQPVAVAIGCGGLVITLLLLLFVGPLTGMWVNRSINEWAVRRSGIRESIAAGRAAVRFDFARHLLICIAMIVVALAGASFFSSFSFFAAFGDAVGSRHGSFNLLFFPLRIVGSLLNSIFSAIVSAWYLASYSALAAE